MLESSLTAEIDFNYGFWNMLEINPVFGVVGSALHGETSLLAMKASLAKASAASLGVAAESMFLHSTSSPRPWLAGCFPTCSM